VVARLVYGRLDPQDTPPSTGDADVLGELRRVFPGVGSMTAVGPSVS
jgi:hypothetical protein